METTSERRPSTSRSACGRPGGTTATTRRPRPIDKATRRPQTRSEVGSRVSRWGMVAATAFALVVCAGGAASAAPVPNAWGTAGLGPASTNGFIGDVAVGRAGHAYMAVNDQLATSANGGQTWSPTGVPPYPVSVRGGGLA